MNPSIGSWEVTETPSDSPIPLVTVAGANTDLRLELSFRGTHTIKLLTSWMALADLCEARANVLTKIEQWLDGVRNEQDRTRFEQRWNTLQDEAAELRVLILRALA